VGRCSGSARWPALTVRFHPRRSGSVGGAGEADRASTTRHGDDDHPSGARARTASLHDGAAERRRQHFGRTPVWRALRAARAHRKALISFAVTSEGMRNAPFAACLAAALHLPFRHPFRGPPNAILGPRSNQLKPSHADGRLLEREGLYSSSFRVCSYEPRVDTTRRRMQCCR